MNHPAQEDERIRPLGEALGIQPAVTRSAPERAVTETPLGRAEYAYACGEIVKRCRRICRWHEARRVAFGVREALRRPSKRPGKASRNGTMRIDPVSDTEWGIRLEKSEGFGLGLISPHHRQRSGEEASRMRISHLQATIAERGTGFVLGGHMVLIPEEGQEAWFREWFGVEGDSPHARLDFEDDPVIAAQLVNEALSRPSRPAVT